MTHRNTFLVILLAQLLPNAPIQVDCFVVPHISHDPRRNSFVITTRQPSLGTFTAKQHSCGSPTITSSSSSLSVSRYGPQNPPPSQEGMDDDNDYDDGTQESSASDGNQQEQQQRRRMDDDDNIAKTILQRYQQDAFQELVDQVLTAERPELLPRILANNMELVMSLQQEGMATIIHNLLADVKKKQKDDDDSNNNEKNNNGSSSNYNDDKYGRTLQAVDIILSFAEDFVQQAQEMDNHNKQLLGKIIKAMMAKTDNCDDNDDKASDNKNDDDNNNTSNNNISREESLDVLLEQEKDQFTPGFLRHLEGECDRISNAPKMTPESARLLQILRIIQTRVLEELGQEMGEATLVLGQLMGYDNEEELLGVLEAGLTVRGTEFAAEMADLTREALDGFQRVPGGGVDPELVDRVTFIDQRLQRYLEENDAFQ